MGFIFYIAICFIPQSLIFAEINRGKYTVIAPGTIYSNEKYTATVALHHNTQPCHIDLSITGSFRPLNLTQSVLLQPNEVKSVIFDLPILKLDDYYLTVKSSGDCFENFQNTTKLEWASFDSLVRIQTDKAMYMSGDVVNYRVFFMDKNLRPVEPAKGAEICIRDSYNYRLVQKIKNFKTINGIYTGNIAIPKEDQKAKKWLLIVKNGGKYPAEADILIDNIRAQYVAKVEANDVVLDRNLHLTVTANHISGKPVEGKASITLRFAHYPNKNNHPIVKNVDVINGIGKAKVDFGEYKDLFMYEDHATNVFVNALIAEDSTGIEISAHNRSFVYPYRYLMNCVNYNECSSFEEGQKKDVLFQVSHYDGSILNDEKSLIKLTYKEVPAAEESTDITYQGYLNATGFIQFKVALPALSSLKGAKRNSRYYSLEMKFLNEQRKIARVTHQKKPIVQNNSQEYFVLMEQSNEEKLNFNKPHQFIIKSSQPLNYFDYTVIARGTILNSGRINLTDKPNVYGLTLTPQDSWLSNFAIYIDYVDANGEYHYAEQKYHIDESLNPITIIAPEYVEPGETVLLKIQTTPNSTVGILGLDERVFMTNGAVKDLKSSDIEKLLNDHGTTTPNQGGYSAYPGTTSGCVTLTNADYFYNRNAPIEKPYFAYNKRIQTNQAIARPFHVQYTFGNNDGNNEDFVRTLIFDDIECTKTSEVVWSIQIPKGKTNWELTITSQHPSKGLGVAHHVFKATVPNKQLL